MEYLSPKQVYPIFNQLGLPGKGHAIKGLVACNVWDPELLDLLNGLARGCDQTSPEVRYAKF